MQWHPTWEVPLLVSCSYDNSVMLWTDDGDADDWRCAQTLGKESGGHSSTVWQVAFEPHGSTPVPVDKRRRGRPKQDWVVESSRGVWSVASSGSYMQGDPFDVRDLSQLDRIAAAAHSRIF